MTQQPFEFSVPPEMRALAEKSVEQARKAFDGFVKTAEEAASGFEERAHTARTSAKDITQKAMSFAEQNVISSFDLAQKLVSAKDITEVVQLHAEYVRKQMEVLSGQAKDLGRSASEMSAQATDTH
jgi:phasin